MPGRNHRGPTPRIREQRARQRQTVTTLSPPLSDGLSAASAPAIAEIRSGYGLSREKFSRLSGFSVRGIANWEAGVKVPGEQARLRLTELERLRRALSRVIPPESLGGWLDTPNPAFRGLKPLEVIERGQSDRLWQMIFLLESGTPA